MQVKIYEWPLPEDENCCNALIFELIIPGSIFYLRDALHIFRTRIIGLKNKSLTKLRGTWISYAEISKHVKKIDREVTLGSFKKLFSESHYGHKHPTSPDSKFLPPKDYSVSFCDFKNVFSYNEETIVQF